MFTKHIIVVNAFIHVEFLIDSVNFYIKYLQGILTFPQCMQVLKVSLLIINQVTHESSSNLFSLIFVVKSNGI